MNSRVRLSFSYENRHGLHDPPRSWPGCRRRGPSSGQPAGAGPRTGAVSAEIKHISHGTPSLSENLPLFDRTSSINHVTVLMITTGVTLATDKRKCGAFAWGQGGEVGGAPHRGRRAPGLAPAAAPPRGKAGRARKRCARKGQRAWSNMGDDSALGPTRASSEWRETAREGEEECGGGGERARARGREWETVIGRGPKGLFDSFKFSHPNNPTCLVMSYRSATRATSPRRHTVMVAKVSATGLELESGVVSTFTLFSCDFGKGLKLAVFSQT